MKLKILRKEELNKSIAIVLGTRPGIIKFAPIIRRLEKRHIDYFIIHTGQHYSYNMDRKFFEELELPTPKYTNNRISKCKFHGEQTAEMLKSIEKALLKEKPSVVIVGGDANTNLAGALATRKLGITLVHLEAGLRSNEWNMPEEHNRVMIDHISDILLCPTEVARENLVKENIKGKIFLTGNPIVDSIMDHLQLAEKKSNILKKIKIIPKNYFLLTFHREENVDVKEKVQSFSECIQRLRTEYPWPIIFPIHPRTMARFQYFGIYDNLKKNKGLRLIKPVGYLDFLKLLSNALLVLTDSGGIQEEACILNIPCVTLRENTERPETVKIGANIIASTEPERVIKAVNHFLYGLHKSHWKQPFGENCAKKIVDILEKILNVEVK